MLCVLHDNWTIIYDLIAKCSLLYLNTLYLHVIALYFLFTLSRTYFTPFSLSKNLLYALSLSKQPLLLISLSLYTFYSFLSLYTFYSFLSLYIFYSFLSLQLFLSLIHSLSLTQFTFIIKILSDFSLNSRNFSFKFHHLFHFSFAQN